MRSGHEDRWSPNATRPSLLMLRTHKTRMQTHTGEQKSPSLVPARHQMAHLFGPAAQRDSQLAVPTDRRPSSPQVPWQAGGQAGASPRRRSNSHSSLVSLLRRPKKKKAPRQSNRSRAEPTAIRRFKDGDALRRRIPPPPSPLARRLSFVAARGPRVSPRRGKEQTVLFTMDRLEEQEQPRLCRQARIREER